MKKKNLRETDGSLYSHIRHPKTIHCLHTGKTHYFSRWLNLRNWLPIQLKFSEAEILYRRTSCSHKWARVDESQERESQERESKTQSATCAISWASNHPRHSSAKTFKEDHQSFFSSNCRNCSWEFSHINHEKRIPVIHLLVTGNSNHKQQE